MSISIYRQIQNQADLQQTWTLIKESFFGPKLGLLISVIGLMFVNWGIESKKWQLLVKGIQPISYWHAVKSVYSGQAFGFNTINRTGESIGRVIYLEEGNRIRGIIMSAIGSMSQLMVSFVSGIMGLCYLKFFILDSTHHLEGFSMIWIDVLMIILVAGMIILSLLYFRIAWTVKLLENIPLIAKYRFFIQKLEDFHWKELAVIFGLSLIRFLVFLAQYVLLFKVFNVSLHWLDAAALVTVMLLILTIVPSIAMAELGFRGKLSLQLFGLLSTNTLGIVATASGIWLINLIVPAIAGSIFILGIKLFRNKK